MNIQTIADNLRNTIAGKELLLARYKAGNDAIAWAVGDMLEINIDELKRILVDVELCIEKETT